MNTLTQIVCEINDRENKIRFSNGEFHRADGPAIEDTDGNKWWYMHGKLHREDGPAIECNDGTKQWFINGQLHRADGPAIEFASGKTWWYYKDRRYTSLDKFCIAAKMTPEEKTIFLLKWANLHE